MGFLALENTELFCISFGVFLPRMGPAKPHTPHMSFISLPPDPSSPLDDRHLICCHPGISLLPQDQILSDTTHGHIQSCLVYRVLEWNRGFSLCWKPPPHTAEPQEEARPPPADISITGMVLPCGSGNICGLVIRGLCWGMRNLGSNPCSVGDLYVLLP